jgi:AraC-like DNA-binding protein
MEGGSAYHQLPMDIGEFTGRKAELERLVAMAGGDAPLVVTVEGMAGVGKTRFAVHAAHALIRAGRYGEFQLWSDLHGFDADQRIAEPADVLERFLRLLGVPGPRIPREVEDRAALYRDRLAGRPGLVLLDNVSSEEQVWPLLPGDPGSLVVITTRHRLSRLDGAQRLPLEVFRPDEAVALLSRIAGDERVRAEPDQAARVAGLSGHLPLLIALAARRLAARPAWRLADLADLLEARGHTAVDPEAEHGDRSVGANFDLSYRGLPAPQRQLFRLLGLHPGPDFTAGAAAALAGSTVATAEMILEQLLDKHLLQQEVAGRYRFHDLLRDYVRDVALMDEPEPRREAARRRCMRWYLDAADTAVQVLEPCRRRGFQLDTADVSSLRPRIGSDAEALAWCDGERANLVAVAHAAAGTEVAWQLPAVLMRFFYRRSHWADWLDTHRMALASARESGDRRGEATVLNGLGVAYGDLHRFAESIEHSGAAAELFAATGDAWGQAWCLNNVGVSYVDSDDPAAAIDPLREGLALFRRVGDLQGITTCLNNLGDAYRLLRRPAAAIDCLHEAIDLLAPLDAYERRYAYGTLGDVYRDSGENELAIEHYRLALAGYREAGDRRGAGRVLHRLGKVLAETGQLASAREHLSEAVTILDELGHPEAASIDLPAPALNPRQRALFGRIQAFTESRLADPELSPDGIAAAHHISVRSLYKLFQAEDTTVAAWIRTRRLEHCRQDLVDPALAERPIGAIAARWGFASPAQFNRAFRAEYDVTPGEYRRAHS